MICPECKNEMKAGIIPVPSGAKCPMQWLPEDAYMKKTWIPVTKTGTQKLGGEILSVKTDAMIPHINAFICKKCRKIIIDY
ncbi:PF20097 family protein [Porcipelethomonas sp.]|uniref:PF20097 family protein n=1 Tax=Porcipelethomonas sp. TaxID=2981675 RepID=UPI003EF76261